MDFNKLLWPSRGGRSIGGGRDQSAPTASPLLMVLPHHFGKVHYRPLKPDYFVKAHNGDDNE